MSFAARCTSASSWSSVMSTRERAQGGLLAAQRGLCAIWMDCIVDWISFLRSTLDRFDRPYRPLPSSASQARRARSPSASASSPWAAWAPWVLALPLAPLAPVTLILTASLDASVAALRAEGMRSESARASTSSSRPSWPQPSSSATAAATATLSSFSSSREPCYRRRRLPPNPEASAIETRSSSLALLEIK